ncbi:MAG: ion channel [Bacteroidota bacterium]|nr:ion channel [Bacteroidota bacterium]
MKKLQDFFAGSGNKEMLFLLISIFVLIFIVYPLVNNSNLSSFVTNIFLLIVLFTGVMSTNIKSNYKKIFVFFLVLLIILGQIGAIYENNFVTHLHLFSRILLLWILVILVFVKVFNNNTISFFYRITGSITIYLLIGFIWANMYFIFYMFRPDAFHFSFPVNPQDNVMFIFIYFSFENLTTLGYGDILPLKPFLKSLVILESVIGPLYLAILIGRLVSKRTRNS